MGSDGARRRHGPSARDALLFCCGLVVALIGFAVTGAAGPASAPALPDISVLDPPTGVSIPDDIALVQRRVPVEANVVFRDYAGEHDQNCR